MFAGLFIRFPLGMPEKNCGLFVGSERKAALHALYRMSRIARGSPACASTRRSTFQQLKCCGFRVSLRQAGNEQRKFFGREAASTPRPFEQRKLFTR